MSSEKNFAERLRTWAVLTVFPAVLLLISVVDMLRPAKLYSSYENRKLQQKPELSVQAVRTGSYMKEYEDYVADQILGRNRYIAIKSATDRALGKKEINGVYLATDGTLIEKHTEEFSTQNIEKTLEGLQTLERLLQGKSRSFQVLLAPTADNVYSENCRLMRRCFRKKRCGGSSGMHAEKIRCFRMCFPLYAVMRKNTFIMERITTGPHWGLIMPIRPGQREIM